METIFKWIGVFVVFCIVVAIFAGDNAVSNERNDVSLGPDHLYFEAIFVDEVLEGPLEARLNLRHLSGSDVAVLVVDKPTYLAIERGTVGGRDADYLHPDLGVFDFNGRQTVDWVPIGDPHTVYLVTANLSRRDSARVSVELEIRERE